jgi:hypothetical protein
MLAGRGGSVTDRELLEAAAKAAGLTPYDDTEMFQDNAGDVTTFDPLHDDGDALRLAIKMHFAIDLGVMSTSIDGLLDDQRDIAVEFHLGDPYAATRRAIVRAAAEIGRTVDAQPESVG